MRVSFEISIVFFIYSLLLLLLLLSLLYFGDTFFCLSSLEFFFEFVYPLYMSVFFLKGHQICPSQNHKNQFFCLLLSYFGNIQPKFSQKDKSIASNTVKYFQEHRRKEYSKIKRFVFCLIIGLYLKFLSSKIIYMQV